MLKIQGSRTTIRVAVLAAVLAFSGPVVSRSGPSVSSHSATSSGNGTAQTSIPMAGTAKAAPLYVSATCERGCGYSEDSRSFYEKLWSDPVAAFTFVLAVSTIFLWWETKKSSDTAKRALLDLERPIVYGAVSKPGLKVVDGQLDHAQVELTVFNHGRTLARLRRLEWDVCLAPKDTIADPIDPHKVGGRELPIGTVCVDGDPYSESVNLFPVFTLGQRDDIARGKQSVWVIGFVRYIDIFGSQYINGFAQVFDPIGGRFVRRGGDLYNFERKEFNKKIPPPSYLNQGEA